MSKKAFFSVFFIIISLGICLLIANEYLKRVEMKAINGYLSTLQGELNEKKLTLDFSQTQCSGFLKHTCKISDISLDSPSLMDSVPFEWQNRKISFSDTSLAITDISTNKIAVSVNVGAISQNLLFLPKNFAYSITLSKQDSSLGYVMLDRNLRLDIGNIEVMMNFAVLIRGKRFANKSVLFLLKEWFDPTTPSFYEYSLENLNISLNAKGAVKTDFYEANKQNLQYLLDNLNITNSHLRALADAIISLMKNEITHIDFSVLRKNNDLIFFNALTDTATTKKALEIKEIIDSINDSYAITMKKE